MANFKVVFRSDNQGADTSPGWEPGCPLLVNAVQVSRNTDTGQCYLQLKLSNISGATVNSFKLQADVSYVDGANETAELNPLDADIQPAKTYRPEPVLLTGSQITNVIVRVLSVSQPEIEWHAEAGSEPGPIPVGTELVLDKKAATERTKSLEELYKDSSKYRHAVTLGNTWWVCSCGIPNVDRDRCCRCDLSKDYLVALEDEQSLIARCEERRIRTAKRKRKTLIASASFIIAVVAALAILFFTTDIIVPNASYNAAARLLSEKNYDSAYSAFLKLGTYRGSDQAAQECALQAAQSALNSEEFATLERWYSRINRKNEIDGSIREKASQLSSENKLGSAAGLYQIIGDEEAENQTLYQYVKNNYDGDYNEFVVKFLGQLAQNNYEDSRDLRNSYIERWKSEYPDIAE